MIKKLLYLKFCWSRATGHLGVINQIIEYILLGGIFIKVFNINNYQFVWLIGSFLVISMFLIGHWDLKKGIAEKEISLHNKYDPEIQKLLKK